MNDSSAPVIPTPAPKAWSGHLLYFFFVCLIQLVLAGTALATPFTLANPIEVEGVFPFGTRVMATLLPDYTTSGDHVCLDPASSCLDPDVFIFRVRTSALDTLVNIGFSYAINEPMFEFCARPRPWLLHSIEGEIRWEARTPDGIARLPTCANAWLMSVRARSRVIL
jgi:hypothetical protein